MVYLSADELSVILCMDDIWIWVGGACDDEEDGLADDDDDEAAIMEANRLELLPLLFG